MFGRFCPALANPMKCARPISNRCKTIRKKVVKELTAIDQRYSDADIVRKDRIRAAYSTRRAERSATEASFVDDHLPTLINCFADGREIDPARILPRLDVVAGGWKAALFRLTCKLWSVPVSRGYGRRIRCLVWDDHNSKLLGLLAIGDPVFNLKVRDDWIGWTAADRKDRLCNVMDAFVLGAVPPYNKLICGKLVGALLASEELGRVFRRRYGNTRGIIDKTKKNAKLVLVTTTSALGRSAIYNRLRLNGSLLFQPIGFTSGWGHFHFSDEVFEDMLGLLKTKRHRYARGYKFGNGPNWRMRVIREALDALDLSQDLLLHGIQREVFAIPLARNFREVLRGEAKRCLWQRHTVKEISAYCKERWIVPRSVRDETFRAVSRETIAQMLRGEMEK